MKIDCLFHLISQVLNIVLDGYVLIKHLITCVAWGLSIHEHGSVPWMKL